MTRYSLLVLSVVVGLSASASAGEAEKFFSERVKDFGTVPYGPTLTHQFKVTNTTNNNVFITGARVSCGCVAATVKSNALKPGESTYVVANMDTKRFIGQKEVTVFVSFGQPFEEVTLAVRANRNDSFSKTAEAVAIGQVRKGHEATGTIQVTMRNDAYFELRNPTSLTEYVSASAKLVRRSGSEVVYDVSATLKPGLDVGLWTTDILFASTNPTLPQVRIPVVVEVIAPITVTPAVVQFPMVKVGDKKELSVVVKGDRPFKILDVKGGDGLVTAEVKDKDSKAAHIVRLVFQPSEAGELTRTITVLTDGGVGKVSIPVRGKAKMDD